MFKDFKVSSQGIIVEIHVNMGLGSEFSMHSMLLEKSFTKINVNKCNRICKINVIEFIK